LSNRVTLGSISKTVFTPFGEYPIKLCDNCSNSECRLCVQTPFAGGRVFEKGDEEFLEFAKQGESFKRSRIELSSRS